MKKFLLFGIVTALILSLTACGNETDTNDKEDMPSVEQSQSVPADNGESDRNESSSSISTEIGDNKGDTPFPMPKATDGHKDDKDSKSTSDSKANQMKDEKDAKELSPEAKNDENVPPIPEPVGEDEIPPIPEPFDDGSSHSESGSQKEEPKQQVLVP